MPDCVKDQPGPDVTSPDRELDAAYEGLVRSHRAAFERLARRLARNPDDAEDLLQETLVDVYRAFHRFRPESQFYSWVARIMTNNWLDRARRKRHPVVSLDHSVEPAVAETLELPDETANPERLLLRGELDQPFQAALDSLPSIHRSTVRLCDLEGATYEEAAAAEACPVGTIRSRLHRAHKFLQKCLSHLEIPTAVDPAVTRIHSRRAFLRMGTAAAAGAAFTQVSAADDAAAGERTVRVLVWSDGTANRSVAHGGISEAIAEALRAEPDLEVRTTFLDDAGQGLSDAVLAEADVLVWWGDRRQSEVREERAAAVARRVRDGKLGLVAVHAGRDARVLRALLGDDTGSAAGKWVESSSVDLRVTAPRHPIARGVGAFRIERTERPEGKLDLRRPDVVVFDGTYAAGGAPEWQGMVWTVGRGRVFYFQPGHTGSPVCLQEEVRKVFRNAVRWTAPEA